MGAIKMQTLKTNQDVTVTRLHGGLMKSKGIFAIAACLLGLGFGLSPVVLAQQRADGTPQAFPQPPAAKEVTVTEIPGVIAAGAKWTLIWGGPDNADGLVGTADGGILFAQEQPSRIIKIDKNDKASIFLENTDGTGALAIDSKGRVLGVERTCTDPGGHPDRCTEPTAVAVLIPERKILADKCEGKGLGRLNDLVADTKGGVYFNGDAVYYVSSKGQVSCFGEGLRTNGIMLSRDEKNFYVTNEQVLVAFDVQPDGTVKNQRDFAKLEAGGAGDGMAIDSAGRLYVSSGAPGIQVFSAEGKYLGAIPLPRPVSSIAFSGPGKKILYAKGAGALDRDGKEFRTPDGVRNNSKSVYKISMLAQGFEGRPK